MELNILIYFQVLKIKYKLVYFRKFIECLKSTPNPSIQSLNSLLVLTFSVDSNSVHTGSN